MAESHEDSNVTKLAQLLLMLRRSFRLILGSWILPALVFGLMIYGWPFVAGLDPNSDEAKM